LIFWIDAQLSPQLARWLFSEFDVEAKPIRELGLRDAGDRLIFMATREAEAVVLTEDSDFVRLLEQFGPPPQILWHTIGNTLNGRLREVLSKNFPTVQSLLRSEFLVEISDKL
jgi:predicted nuclease of predicted toxin-antitoxin system